MQTFQRSITAAGRHLQRTSRQQVRRYADHSHGSAHHSTGPHNESLGRGFYITIALIPTSLALYKLSGQGTGEQPYLTRVINSYDSWRQSWLERNDLHTQMIEQAASDRNLFLNSKGSKHVDLKFPEALNQGSPWNVPAGHGANIDHAIAKYQKEAYEDQERKLKALRENNIPDEKPYQRPAGSLAQ